MVPAIDENKKSNKIKYLRFFLGTLTNAICVALLALGGLWAQSSFAHLLPGTRRAPDAPASAQAA